MDILRFITAGNVDDGKSTLIGRLLYETDSIKSDILTSVSGETSEEINLAHITDGLRSERELGITIDVAYKYFSTPNRKYIITDAPGHFQFMKNMVTGASSVDAIIILIDAVNGVTEQTRRHSLVASFLKTKHVLVAINKMDAVGYDVGVFNTICVDYSAVARKLELRDVAYIPISALKGDNITSQSTNMAWYWGKTILDYLESVKQREDNQLPGRMSIQCKMNGNESFYGAKVLSGKFAVGEQVYILPNKQFATITKIFKGYEESTIAKSGDNISIVLSPESSVVRGNLVSSVYDPARVNNEFEASICWLDADRSLTLGASYFLRINTFEVECEILDVLSMVNSTALEEEFGDKVLNVNEFAKVLIRTYIPVAYDLFLSIQSTGRGILIDKRTNFTSGAFVISA